MGSVPPELRLDFRPTFVPKTITDFLREVSLIGSVSEKLSKLESFLKGFEDELRKIDAFKRELPLCMLLLNDAILVLKESMQCARGTIKVLPVLEDFIPLKKSNSDDEDGDEATRTIRKEKASGRDHKKNWMSSVQLWNSDDHHTSDPIFDIKQNLNLKIKINEQENPFQACKSRDGDGARAFMPFKTCPAFPSRKDDQKELPIHGLSLVTPGIKNPREDIGSRTSCSKSVSSSAPNVQSYLRTGPQPLHQQTTRKQRRCWSPELHRQFVNALRQLGGSQVATPKQIRELMQVDGLTNDEVKSHLQKYRLHTCRTSPASSAAPANQSKVFLGSLWMSQDQYGDSSKVSNSQSGSPQGPLQLTGNTGGTSITGDDSMEDDDVKSEGYSRKSHINKTGKEDVECTHHDVLQIKVYMGGSSLTS